MPKYIIERELPGAGNLGDTEIQGISQKSCSVLTELGPQIQWVESFVTDAIGNVHRCKHVSKLVEIFV